MPKLPYLPTPRSEAAEHSWLRVLGGILTFLSILLALLGIIFHQRVPDLIVASIVGLFALRVFLLWLGAQPQHHQPSAGCSARQWVRYPLQAPPAPLGQPASSASPYSPTQPLSQLAPEPYRQQSLPMLPAAVVPLSPTWPRSIGPQRPPQAPALPAQPAPPPQGVPPLSPAPPPALWPPPLYAASPMPSPAPVPWPPQQENWQVDDGKHGTQQQRGTNHGTT